MTRPGRYPLLNVSFDNFFNLFHMLANDILGLLIKSNEGRAESCGQDNKTPRHVHTRANFGGLGLKARNTISLLVSKRVTLT